MEVWVSKSNQPKQLLTAAGCVIVGLALVAGFRNFGSWGSNEGAGFMLGILLLLIGVAGVVTAGSQTVTVDPRSRRILVRESSRLTTKEKVILFADIEDIRIGYLGKKSTGVTFYYLDLKLRSGGTYPLFAAGRFYRGGSDRATVEGWRQRLQMYLVAGQLQSQPSGHANFQT
jgi:hypothetical protein